MTKPTLLCAVLSLFAAFAGGCDKTTEADELQVTIEDMVSELNAQTEIGCDCWEQLGYGTKSACEDNEILPAKRRCIEDALMRDASASLDRFSCIVPLEEEYTACIDSRLSCEDLSSADPCGKDYQIGLERCEELPKSVQRAYDDCFE